MYNLRSLARRSVCRSVPFSVALGHSPSDLVAKTPPLLAPSYLSAGSFIARRDFRSIRASFRAAPRARPRARRRVGLTAARPSCRIAGLANRSEALSYFLLPPAAADAARSARFARLSSDRSLLSRLSAACLLHYGHDIRLHIADFGLVRRRWPMGDTDQVKAIERLVYALLGSAQSGT